MKPIILSMTNVTGYKVRNAAAEDLGKIEDIVLEDEGGRILYGIVSVGGFLHIGNRLIAIPWYRLRLEPDEKTFLLNIDKETLENAPHFDRGTWPDMSQPDWQNRVNTYFAYNPADEQQAIEGAEFIEGGPRSTSTEERTHDERLARRVEFELFATKAFNMDGIHVTARDATVTLEGRVGSRAESILAENTALAAEGVRRVTNNLKVSKVA